jgi:4-oxalocrotonate tautomerase
MPLLQVSLIEGRSAERMQELIRALCATVVETLDVRAESVRVILTEVPAAHWGIGGVSKAAREREETA